MKTKYHSNFVTPFPPVANASVLGLLLAASCIAGCMGFDPGSHDLGRTADQLTASDDLSDLPPSAVVEDFGGTWIGEAEDPLAVTADGSIGVYHFPSGSSQIKLEIGRDTAAITLGEGTPAPVSDFDVGYPTDVEYVSEALLGSPLLPPVEGFTYYLQAQNDSGVVDLGGLYDAHVRDGVIRLFYEQNEFLRDWCAGQTPKPSGSGMSCLGSGGNGVSGLGAAATCSFAPMPSEVESSEVDPTGEADNEMVPVDCGKLYLCELAVAPVCRCDADGCSINASTRSGLFLRLAGDELIGSFAQGVFARAGGLLTTLGTVRFRRVEP